MKLRTLLKALTISSILLLQGCFTLALNYADGQNRKQQREKFIENADAGDKIAQYHVAETYCCGYGNHLHSDKAISYYCQSAKQGYSRAAFRLGNIYEGDFSFSSSIRMINNDLGDRVKAYSWYRIAANQGYIPAVDKAKKLRGHLDTSDILKGNVFIENWQNIDCQSP